MGFRVDQQTMPVTTLHESASVGSGRYAYLSGEDLQAAILNVEKLLSLPLSHHATTMTGDAHMARVRLQAELTHLRAEQAARHVRQWIATQLQLPR